MDDEEAVKRGGAQLMSLKGIIAARIVERGAMVRYDPGLITKDQICHALAQAGFRASVFQDEKTGETERSSQ